MDYVHHCVFCGWHRPASSATILGPCCEHCGCTLVASDARSFESPPERPPAAQPLFDPRAARAGRLIVLVAVLAGAARAGHVEGGPALALAAFGLAGLLGVPLAVED